MFNGFSFYHCCHISDTADYNRRAKSIPLKNLANFSRTIERYNIKFYASVTHSIIRKCENARSVPCILLNLALLLASSRWHPSMNFGSRN